jgi:UDP-N-acetylglucosamine acyltransferase
MGKRNIHPLAVVETGAEIGDNVTIEPYAIIKGKAVLEDDVVIKSHAYIDGNTTIGRGTVIWPSASIGTKTQAIKYRGEETYVKIGQHCEIREFATINSSTTAGSTVKVGDHCLIMAYCHIAHSCEVGNHVVMSNSSMLAGHVIVEDYAILGGMTPVHQFVRIGCHAMVGGLSRVTQDVPPYTIGGGIPYCLAGINRVGLKRRKFSFEVQKALFAAYRYVYRSGIHLLEALECIEKELPPFEEIKHFVSFCRKSKRGLIGMQGIYAKPTSPKICAKENLEDDTMDVELAENSL